jgi:hypothetical protein
LHRLPFLTRQVNTSRSASSTLRSEKQAASANLDETNVTDAGSEILGKKLILEFFPPNFAANFDVL